MVDATAVISAFSAAGSLLCSAAVVYYTRLLTDATGETRDAAKAQARAAQATTLTQLGPVIGQRVDRFVEDHRSALERVERLIVDDKSLAAAIVSAYIGEQVGYDDFEECRVHALHVSEIIPDRVDGSTNGPKVFSVVLSVKPLSQSLQLRLRRSGHDEDDFTVPRWGAGDVFVIDEAFSRSIYGALWPAIHDANEISQQVFFYEARDLLRDHISRDWRVHLAFKLAESGYFTPLQYRRYKLQGKTIVGRLDGTSFSPRTVADSDDIPELDYRSISVIG